MKIKFECPSCLINRACVESEKAVADPFLRLETLLSTFTAIAIHATVDVTPAYLGTIRDRTIKRVSRNPDPFREDKRASNEAALKSVPQARDYVLDGVDQSQRFRRACLVSIVGNAFEFGIKGYHFEYESIPRLIEAAEDDIAIDHISEIETMARRSSKMLLLADNAGEIAFDSILIEQLRQMGISVTVAVKAAPISNDATMEDAVEVGISDLANRVITTGTDSVGLLLEECSAEFLAEYERAELIIAKGMAHYETLSELKLARPHALMFKAKCSPIASNLGVPLGKNVAILARPEFRGDSEINLYNSQSFT